MNYCSFESDLSKNNALSEKDYKDLEKIFIGNNYIGIEDSRLSFSSLLFGPIYALYRKLYLIGILWIFVYVILLLNFSVYSVFYVGLILNITMFFIFNSLYLKIVKKKINKIINRYPNYNLEQLKRVCAKVGQTSPIFIVIFILLGLLLFLNYFVVPLLVDKINNTSIVASKVGVENYINSVNLVMTTELLEKKSNIDGTYIIEKDGSISKGNNNYQIEISYNHPLDGRLVIKNGAVEIGEISYGEVVYVYNGKISLKK